MGGFKCAHPGFDGQRSPTARRTGVPDLGEVERPVARVEAGLDPDLAAALAALDPEQRAAIVLRYLLEYTPGEIARMLELPRGTVNSRLRRGLDHLADALEEVPR